MEKLNKFKKILNKFYYQLFIENFKYQAEADLAFETNSSNASGS